MATSNMQLATLFILSLLYAATQNAPVQTQMSTELTAKTQHFYCISYRLKALASRMVDVSK